METLSAASVRPLNERNSLVMQSSESSIFLLIEAFVNGKLSAVRFEQQYIELWKKLRDDQWSGINLTLPKEILAVLGQIWIAVDCFCSDPHLRDIDDLDEAGLLAEVSSLAKKLPIKVTQSS